ncbi:hypothetical protein F7725_005970 [Dissostichus mawsoni]|uniref:Uncharacterized protein n=1 Tax=Dissostichus mawsoni TaxID=36200 RepID=A0A7J5YT23_DISMA|nr:hypothetical protein F7725_005970 [Dissostichus mawsoni]
MAVKVAVEILKKMSNMYAAEKLTKKYAGARKQQLKEKYLNHQSLRLLQVFQLDRKSPLMVQLVPPLPRPQLPQI